MWQRLNWDRHWPRVRDSVAWGFGLFWGDYLIRRAEPPIDPWQYQIVAVLLLAPVAFRIDEARQARREQQRPPPPVNGQLPAGITEDRRRGPRV